MYTIIKLHKEKYLDDIIMALTQAGVEDTIVVSGESMSHKLIYDMPLFAGFRESMGSDKSYTSLIMAIADEKQVDFMLKELQSSGVDFKEDDLGRIVILPVTKII